MGKKYLEAFKNHKSITYSQVCKHSPTSVFQDTAAHPVQNLSSVCAFFTVTGTHVRCLHAG